MALHIASLLLVISATLIAGQDFVVGSSDSGACIGSYCCDGKARDSGCFASHADFVVFGTRNGKATNVSKACAWFGTRWLSTRPPCGDSTLETPS